MKFVNIKQFAELKGCSRENIYNAEKKGEVSIDRSAGFPVVFITEKNKNWKPRRKGRPTKNYSDLTLAEFN